MSLPTPRLGFLALALATFLPGRLPAASANLYYDTVLVANRAEFSPRIFVDPNLVNPWGIALRPPGAGGHIWVSNAGSVTTTTYIGDVNGTPLYQDGLKIVPIEGGQTSPGGHTDVTGQVYNAASDIAGQPVEFFVSGPADSLSSGRPVPIGVTAGPAKFVFVTLDGTINAWRANTATSMRSAVLVKDFSAGGLHQIPSLKYTPAFTGVAMETSAFTLDGANIPVADNRLYAADFQNNRIQVFNNQWADITAAVPFQRPANLPTNYSPFNIQYLGGRLYVAYALLDPDAEERATDLPDEGVGHVVAYDRNGQIVQEMDDAGRLNSPWGLAIAPATFGAFGGSLLVANFGDGRIAAFNPATGAFQGYLHDGDGEDVSIDGVWGLTFGNGVSLGDANSLYYTAGPNGEQDGVFGRLTLSPEPPRPPLPPVTLPIAPDRAPLATIRGKSPATTTAAQVRVEGTATDDRRVDRILLRVNDGAFHAIANRRQWSATVRLRPGKNTILVRAIDSANQKSPAARRIILRK